MVRLLLIILFWVAVPGATICLFVGWLMANKTSKNRKEAKMVRTRKWKYKISVTQGNLTTYNNCFASNASEAIDKAIDESLVSIKKCMPDKLTVEQKRDYVFN